MSADQTRRGRWRGRARLRRPGRPGTAIVERLERIEKSLAKLERGQKQAPRGPKVRDASFSDAARRVVGDGRTLLEEDRLWILWQAVANVAPLGLPVAEVGSYRGGSAFFLASALEQMVGGVPFEVIDTFEGHPSADVTDADHLIHRPGHFDTTSFEDVRDYLSPFADVTVRKGAFSEVAPALPHPTYGLVHLDVDLYKPTKAGLEYFGSRLAGGGVIVLDDYGAKKCPGVQQAASEFLSTESGFQSWNPHTEQLVIVRIG